MLLWFDPITSFPAPDKGLSVPANILFFGLPLPSSSSNPHSPESENRRHLEKSPQSNLIRSGRGVKVKVISRCGSESNPSQILSLAPPPAQVPTPVTTTLRTGKRGKFSLTTFKKFFAGNRGELQIIMMNKKLSLSHKYHGEIDYGNN